MGKDIAKKFAIGTAVAAVAGYLAGLLTAPKAGKDTRQDIKDNAAKGVAEAEKQLQSVQDELKAALDDASSKGEKLGKKAKEELEGLVAKAGDAKSKVAEVTKALKSGAAEDKELQKALDEAKTALKHLRTYLSK
ncbi:MAG: YtxH domain-containing protein [Candidatus Saccharimonadales bacterium]